MKGRFLMLRVNGQRLWDNLNEMGRIGAGERGRTRLAFTDEDLEARRLLVRWMEELGLEVHTDPYANIWGLRAGREELPPIVVGSHIDTVREAGMFDGVLGVLSGLEAVRALNEAGVSTRRPVAVISFSDEEGGRFSAGTMTGSRLMAGCIQLEELAEKRDQRGVSWLEALERSGFTGSSSILRPHAYLEYHIEQGPVLCDKGARIGVVEGVVNLSWMRFTFYGQANHAGAFPMERRRDAGLAASSATVALNRLAFELGAGTVITSGQALQEPNLPNIVPGRAVLTVDLRSFKEEVFASGLARAEAVVEEEAARHGVEVSVELLTRLEGAVFAREMTELVERTAGALDLSSWRMPSGAGHDAQIMSRLCPTAMIFCPSEEGRSHCPEEFTSQEDAVAGADVLLNCLLELAED